MSKESIDLVQEKTFYLYDYSNVLVKRAKKIYSPYNIKTLGRTPSEDYYNTPDFVEFKDGQYTAKVKQLGQNIFDQQCEWLGFYNPQGGQLSKGLSGQKHLNGRYYKNDGIHYIKAERIDLTSKVEVKTITEKVEVQQLPLIIARNMNVKQLQELANAWNVEIQENILDLGDADKIKDSLIETMTQAGHIK